MAAHSNSAGTPLQTRPREPGAIPIATIPKGETSQLRFQLRIYKDRHVFDARVFKSLGRHTDVWTPSAEGFAIDISKLPLLRDAIIDAEAKARSLKWLKEGRS